MASRAEIKRTTCVASVLLLSLLVTGCGKGNNPRTIDAKAFEDETGASWPLTVDKGQVHCDEETKSVYFYDPETTNSYIVGEGRLHPFTKRIAAITKSGTDIEALRQFGLGLGRCDE